MLEVLIHVIGTVSTICFILSIIYIGLTILGIIHEIMEHETFRLHEFTKISWMYFIPIIFISVTPDVEDLIKIRLQLIKYSMYDVSIINKNEARIEERFKAMECKYLNCDKAEVYIEPRHLRTDDSLKLECKYLDCSQENKK